MSSSVKGMVPMSCPENDSDPACTVEILSTDGCSLSSYLYPILSTSQFIPRMISSLIRVFSDLLPASASGGFLQSSSTVRNVWAVSCVTTTEQKPISAGFPPDICRTNNQTCREVPQSVCLVSLADIKCRDMTSGVRWFSTRVRGATPALESQHGHVPRPQPQIKTRHSRNHTQHSRSATLFISTADYSHFQQTWHPPTSADYEYYFDSDVLKISRVSSNNDQAVSFCHMNPVVIAIIWRTQLTIKFHKVFSINPA